MNEEDALRIAGLVLTMLEDRGGFDHWWHEIEPEDQDEIKGAIADIIREGE